MKLVIIACLIAVALAAPQAQKEPIAIISQDSVLNEDGSYQYSYETADGTKAQEAGQQKVIDNEAGTAAQGSFSFVGVDGVTYSITYTSDENGFVPQGDHLPQAPEIPEAIVKALAYNAAHPEEDNLK